MDRDRDHKEQREYENEGERKIRMDFRGLSHHVSTDHSRDADTDVIFFV